jgi:hypothetical protein
MGLTIGISPQRWRSADGVRRREAGPGVHSAGSWVVGQWLAQAEVMAAAGGLEMAGGGPPVERSSRPK